MSSLGPSLTEDELTSLLARISQKQSVQSLIILDRSSGSIIRSSGSIAANRNSESLIGEYAGMVWKFVKSAEEMVGGMDDEDDLKLLRVRTKRHELVIVPDPRFILVVFHDTPTA
ncbi:uncharacterized protein LAJ45_02033 [Morchella importuna]|uniref:Roadblock/LAMTOR2 domain-containing protein n=1 Tax=Morchella conica CCBAS932 TaxID=1392247 RepID=A0A3N4L664_9PEZI|nr:uncharacterized protein LAJ45_02033 [Morchella importuna]KAH8154265.1 hypothetical protein LAJ45_02033 [Morchella importuna]RPB16992.1 hypothetical protein P167DRAFT_499678 [Morchella conica CCBAS932]